MGTMASQITGVSIVCLSIFSGADQRTHQSSASLAFVMGIHRWAMDSSHKGLHLMTSSCYCYTNDAKPLIAWTNGDLSVRSSEYYLRTIHKTTIAINQKITQWCSFFLSIVYNPFLYCANPPMTVGFPQQRPVTLSFDVFFDLRLNKRLSKQSRHRWFETPSRSLLRHCNYTVLRNDFGMMFQ